ncbi:DUF3871 family protein [Paraflavitalea speifideaquila]|uniref:DUF3871 family protein n=1 Tax=Paraflavitalea speifideaquila TaxID=3076558 RepID=UPI0028EFD231|nr:DUF3871 family protein [Paraflavitalea speifideiaquila]
MELLPVKPAQSNGITSIVVDSFETPVQDLSTDKPFIQANTEAANLQEITHNHIIPVFIKDNEPLISHGDFIDTTVQVISEVYRGETILSPCIRVSHPVKGRIPEARNKPAIDLQEWEKTLYYERMAFIIEVPGIWDTIEGNTLSLTIGGIKAYNMDNLYGRKGSDEHFKLFIGFQNRVCMNLKVWSDGYTSDVRVSNINQLKACIRALVENYNATQHISALKSLTNYALTEQQFALLIGRSRMYHHLPPVLKSVITPLLLSDTQISTVVKDYYRDGSFCKLDNGDISLWRLYNLFTGSNKSSYIDTFLDRSISVYNFTEGIRNALDSKTPHWFLH